MSCTKVIKGPNLIVTVAMVVMVLGFLLGQYLLAAPFIFSEYFETGSYHDTATIKILCFGAGALICGLSSVLYYLLYTR